MLEIDGSFGEGGGQILRTALGLSCLFHKPFRMFNIRRGRKKPGMMPQHLAGIAAAKLISNAEVRGDSSGSSELFFSPKEVKSGDFFFDIGTAGSTSLVLQTILPALAFSKGKTTVTLMGGTHVPFSPSFHYLAGVFRPFLKMLGFEICLSIESYGFYPKGGGKIRVEIFPAAEIRPLKVIERGSILQMRALSGVGNLPVSIAKRQGSALFEKIQSAINNLDCPFDVEIVNIATPGQGTFICLESKSQNSLAGFTSLGERGKKAEAVGVEAASEFLRYYVTSAALDPHLPDQIVLYLSLCQEESAFTTSCITNHLTTNLWVISLFHEFRYVTEGEAGKPGMVQINFPTA